MHYSIRVCLGMEYLCLNILVYIQSTPSISGEVDRSFTSTDIGCQLYRVQSITTIDANIRRTMYLLSSVKGRIVIICPVLCRSTGQCIPVQAFCTVHGTVQYCTVSYCTWLWSTSWIGLMVALSAEAVWGYLECSYVHTRVHIIPCTYSELCTALKNQKKYRIQRH